MTMPLTLMAPLHSDAPTRFEAKGVLCFGWPDLYWTDEVVGRAMAYAEWRRVSVEFVKEIAEGALHQLWHALHDPTGFNRETATRAYEELRAQLERVARYSL